MEEKTVQTVKTAKRSFVGLVTSEKMDKTIDCFFGLYVGLYHCFKKHLCIKTSAGKDRKAIKKVYRACGRGRWNG